MSLKIKERSRVLPKSISNQTFLRNSLPTRYKCMICFFHKPLYFVHKNFMLIVCKIKFSPKEMI